MFILYTTAATSTSRPTPATELPAIIAISRPLVSSLEPSVPPSVDRLGELLGLAADGAGVGDGETGAEDGEGAGDGETGAGDGETGAGEGSSIVGAGVQAGGKKGRDGGVREGRE